MLVLLRMLVLTNSEEVVVFSGKSEYNYKLSRTRVSMGPQLTIYKKVNALVREFFIFYSQSLLRILPPIYLKLSKLTVPL